MGDDKRISGAYNKFVVNLHKEQTSKLQAKNQQELDLLDDIRNFMKQKAAIEKHYADGLLKLSSVYGTKKIAAVGGKTKNNTFFRLNNFNNTLSFEHYVHSGCVTHANDQYLNDYDYIVQRIFVPLARTALVILGV